MSTLLPHLRAANKAIEDYRVTQRAATLGVIKSMMPMALQPLISYIENEKKVSIEIRDVSHLDTNPIAGGLLRLRKNGTALITVNGHNICWRRFYLAKELMHLLCDTQTCMDAETDGFLRFAETLLQTGGLGGIDFDGATNSTSAEYSAIIAAVEFLMPSQLFKRYYQLTQEEDEQLDLAEAFKVPRQWVDFRSRYPDWFQAFA